VGALRVRQGRYPSLPTATIDDYLPEAVLRRHSLADLPEQWVLAESRVGPDTWPEHTLGGWTLRRHPVLPVIGLRDADGAPVGWLLGYPVTEDGVLLCHGHEATLATGRSSEVGEWLDSLGGRWAVLLVASDEPFVRLDACGSLPAVYASGDRIVASTPHLVPYRPGLEDDIDLIRAMNTPLRHTFGGYPLGLTPRRGVRRLLPNHDLRLESFDAVRSWPLKDIEPGSDVDEQVHQISELTGRTIAALVATMPCSLPLTSGRDSRMLLATARDHAPELELFTSRLQRATGVPDWTSLVDARVAGKIARRHGLRHRVAPITRGRDEDLDEWVFRSAGMISAPRAWRGVTGLKILDPRRTRLLGAVGELGRARLWEPNDTPDTEIMPQRLLSIAHLPSTDQTLGEVSTWLENFPTSNAFTTLNVYFLEQGLGCMAAMLTHAEYAGPGFTVFPMNHAGIVRRMCSMPYDFQRSGQLPQAVIRESWPELLDVPFHRDSGVDKVFAAQRLTLGARARVRRWVHPRGR
jgi:hypothetical protein